MTRRNIAIRAVSRPTERVNRWTGEALTLCGSATGDQDVAIHHCQKAASHSKASVPDLKFRLQSSSLHCGHMQGDLFLLRKMESRGIYAVRI
jgi:hypothetical protein